MKYIFLMSSGSLTGFLLALNGYSKDDPSFWVIMILQAIVVTTLSFGVFNKNENQSH